MRHLDQCDYIIPIRQKTGRVLALSGQHNVFLERTWHQRNKLIEIEAHAKFNGSLMNGIQAKCNLSRNGLSLSSTLATAKLYRISDVDWSETFVGNITMSLFGNGLFAGYIAQAALGANELSGRETYSIIFSLKRVRQTFTKKVFFNHLGCYDSLNRLRKEKEFSQAVWE